MCGIVGAWGINGAAVAAFLGLHTLQHRGQESAGILTLDHDNFFLEKGLGILSGGTITQDSISRLKGRTAIGHVRYTTKGIPSLDEAQPFIHRNTSTGAKIAFAHNGQLNGKSEWWQSTRSDSERFGIAFGNASGSLEDRVFGMLKQLQGQGSYALTMLVHDPQEGNAFVAIKSPEGNRPLAVGRTTGAEGYIFASESCAFQGIDIGMTSVKYERELKPGEIIIITEKDGFKSYQGEDLPEALRSKETLACFFEAVYFARPDSYVFGHPVQKIRRDLGRNLAREHPTNADIVVAVPDSARDIAAGYAEQSNIPLVNAITRSHYIGRTFIDPDTATKLEGFEGSRDLALARKFGIVEEAIKGKRIALVDDSLVRGNTMKRLTNLLYRYGAEEVHIRIASPPTTHPCFFGINTPSTTELIAHGRDVDEVRSLLVVKEQKPPTSLGYLSLDGTLSAIPYAQQGVCTACVTGDYKIAKSRLPIL